MADDTADSDESDASSDGRGGKREPIDDDAVLEYVRAQDGAPVLPKEVKGEVFGDDRTRRGVLRALDRLVDAGQLESKGEDNDYWYRTRVFWYPGDDAGDDDVDD